MKLYTEHEIVGFLTMHHEDIICAKTFIKNLMPAQLLIDEEKENLIFGNGYLQGEMDNRNTLKEKGLTYEDGYKEGYQRALDYMNDAIKTKIEIKENGSNTFSTTDITTATILKNQNK